MSARQGNTFAPDYVDVATRLAEFRGKHPEGSLQPADPNFPYRILTLGDETYIAVVAAAYRSPDDARPGIGMAYEIFPGKTPYTRGSELQNAETSAWGRAIMAALAADSRRGIASAEEVRNRSAERNQEPAPEPSGRDWQAEADEAGTPDEVRKLWRLAVAHGEMNEALSAHLQARTRALEADDPWATPVKDANPDETPRLVEVPLPTEDGAA